MARARSTCPHCKQLMPLEHTHSLSQALIVGLRKLQDAGGGPINLKHLELTRNQWDNFQKLKYWGLVEQSFTSTGKRQSGVWEITPKGVKFLAGRIRLPKTVWTQMGKPVSESSDTITAAQAEIPYRKREDYAKDATPI